MELLIFLERIENLCKQKGAKRQFVYNKCGVGKNFGVDIRNGSEPSIGKVFALATELDCSVDYLLGRTDNPQSHNAKTAATVALNDVSNNGVIGGIANNAPVTINNNSTAAQAETLVNMFNSLDPMKQAKLLVFADELNKNKD